MAPPDPRAISLAPATLSFNADGVPASARYDDVYHSAAGGAAQARHVFLAGFRPDVLELLKDFDVFALSSIQEGLCTSLLDAMAASKPAVATAVGGVPEVVADGETGFLVPPKDDTALAEKIVRLLKDADLRRRMGDAGLTRARQHFTVERMVQSTADAYERIVAG